jgi:methionyl-tRNA formyltransferase
LHASAEPITTAGDYDLIVSYNYRHIVPRHLCEAWAGRAVNCHPSALPWNRGAHPNLWAWIDGTPHGVTIHTLAPGLDTGAIVAQRIVDLPPTGTLRTSYARLPDE